MASDNYIGFAQNDLPSTLQDAVETLRCSFRELRTHLHIQKKDASIFAILQEYPCLVRCINELKKPYDKGEDIDKLYMAKEAYAKRILIDEIYSTFGSSVKIKERHEISFGTLDLAIMLEHQGKIIGIEIKNGHSEQTYLKMLHEIERYLIDTYLLLVIRVHTKSVHKFVRDVDSLIQRIEGITRKANLLTSEEISCHGCQWCADQESSGSIAKIDTSFYSKTLEVTRKTIAILEEEFRNQNILEKDDKIGEQQDHTEITDGYVESLSGSNEGSNGEASNVGISDNRNGKRSDAGSIKWLNIKDLKSGIRGVNIKGQIQRITPPRPIKGGTEQIAEVELSDHTGNIILALFNGEIENVKKR